MRTPTRFILHLAAVGLLTTAMACGGGSSGSSTETADITGTLAPVGTASIHTSAASGTTALATGVNIVAVDETGNSADSATNVTDTFTLTVPTGHDYVLIVSDASGILSAVVYKDSSGGTSSEMQIGAGTTTVDLGQVVVDTTNKTAEVKDATAVKVDVKDPTQPQTIEPDKKIMGADTDGDHIPDVVDKSTGSDGTTKDMSHDSNNDGIQDVGSDAGQPDSSESTGQQTGVAGDATAGADLYTANCSGCHGANATGGSGPNIVGEKAGDVRDAIGEVSQMASVASLSGQEMTDIAAYLQSLGSGSEGSGDNEGGSTGDGSGATTGNAVTGATLYAASCSGCHGTAAKGGSGPNIVGRSASSIGSAIGEVSQMAGFSSLTSAQLADIAAWLANPTASTGSTGSGSGTTGGTTGGSTGTTTGGTGGSTGTGGGATTVTGDATAGSVYFSANCAGCHGNDGSGGPVVSRSIRGSATTTISGAFTSVSMMSSLTVPTAQQLANIAAFLTP